MFAREEIRSITVPDAKFQEAKSDYLVQLIVTQEMVAKKIKAIFPLYVSVVKISRYDTFPFTYFLYNVLCFSVILFVYVWT